MPDENQDFLGVPGRYWYELKDRVSFQGAMLYVLTVVVVLLVLALARRGVLASWTDLFTVIRDGG